MEKKHFMVLLIPLLLLFGCSGQLVPQGQMQGSPYPSGGSGQKAASPPSQQFESTSVSELMAKNVSLECTIRMDYQGQAIFSTIYILGRNYRYIAPLPSLGGSGQLEMVFKNDSIYTKLPSQAAPAGCSWIKAGVSSGILEAAPPVALPGARLSCKPGSFKAEIFSTGGKICSDEDMPSLSPTSQ